MIQNKIKPATRNLKQNPFHKRKLTDKEELSHEWAEPTGFAELHTVAFCLLTRAIGCLLLPHPQTRAVRLLPGPTDHLWLQLFRVKEVHQDHI